MNFSTKGCFTILKQINCFDTIQLIIVSPCHQRREWWLVSAPVCVLAAHLSSDWNDQWSKLKRSGLYSRHLVQMSILYVERNSAKNAWENSIKYNCHDVTFVLCIHQTSILFLYHPHADNVCCLLFYVVCFLSNLLNQNKQFELSALGFGGKGLVLHCRDKPKLPQQQLKTLKNSKESYLRTSERATFHCNLCKSCAKK